MTPKVDSAGPGRGTPPTESGSRWDLFWDHFASNYSLWAVGGGKLLRWWEPQVTKMDPKGTKMSSQGPQN